MVSSSEKSPPIPPSSTFPNSLLPPSLLLGVKTLLPLLNTFKKPNCAGVRFSKTPRPIDARCRAACAAAASLYFDWHIETLSQHYIIIVDNDLPEYL